MGEFGFQPLFTVENMIANFRLTDFVRCAKYNILRLKSQMFDICDGL
ncbi:MAG: hypothetical protein DDT21_01855 [Syntrophomonadaceae bacterium]|nr:hypothetical protein [Bacillota bacterium]